MHHHQPMSRIRRIYFARLIARCFVLLCSFLLLFIAPGQFSVLGGMRFFDQPSVLHLLWVVWMLDMLAQIIPIQKDLSLGSMKLFKQRFRSIREKINAQALKAYIISTTRAASWVLLLWTALIAAIGLLKHAGILNDTAMFLLTVIFYVSDLIWCPFRLMMKNRCCTTCRIFNWDHLMMFSPMLFVRGFYSLSLFTMALVVFLVWELGVILFPERFWEYSNAALQCANRTDKLCTQYCRKLRS